SDEFEQPIDQHTGGYIQTVSSGGNSTRLFNFLHPEDPLFQTLLRLSVPDNRLTFKFPVFRLPRTIIKMLANHDNTSLPPVITNNVVRDPYQNAQYIQLNALEYYLFQFVFCAVNRQTPLPTGLSSVLYSDLFAAYLEMLLPLPRMELDFRTHPVDSNVPNMQMIFYNVDKHLADKFIDILSLFWLKQNAPPNTDSAAAVFDNHTAGHSDLTEPPILPTEICVSCCRTLVSHLHKMALPIDEALLKDLEENERAFVAQRDAGAEMAMPSAYGSRVSRTSRFVPKIPDFEADNILKSLSADLYRYLDVCFNHWPMDTTIIVVYRLYFSLAQPWNYLSDPKWADTEQIENFYKPEHIVNVSQDIQDKYFTEYIEAHLAHYTVVLKSALKRLLLILRRDRRPSRDHYALRLLYMLLIPYAPFDPPGGHTMDEYSLVRIMQSVEQRVFSDANNQSFGNTTVLGASAPNISTNGMVGVRRQPFFSATTKVNLIQDLRLEMHRREIIFTTPQVADTLVDKASVNSARVSRNTLRRLRMRSASSARGSAGSDFDLLGCLVYWFNCLIRYPVEYLLKCTCLSVYYIWCQCGGPPPAKWLPYTHAYHTDSSVNRRVNRYDQPSPVPSVRGATSPGGWSVQNVGSSMGNIARSLSEWKSATTPTGTQVPDSAYTKARNVLDAVVVAMGQDYEIELPKESDILHKVAPKIGSDSSPKKRPRLSERKPVETRGDVGNVRPAEVRAVARLVYQICNRSARKWHKTDVETFNRYRFLANRTYLCCATLVLMGLLAFNYGVGYHSLLLIALVTYFSLSI
ncbi:hypothetical protein SARC_09978, partial [Sphaeroforma arctica JP610]